jgi:hypothetical protein
MKRFFAIVAAILSGAIGFVTLVPHAVEAGHQLN